MQPASNRSPHPQLPQKLQDCSAQAVDRELFIVEGDSAARAVGAARSPDFQAVLPMQGKPLNPLKASRADVLQHPKYADVLAVLGISATAESIGGGFDFAFNRLRYQKIVLLFDPDADGIHARSLMHLFFYRWLRPLLDAGHVFDTHAPLWEITHEALEQPIYAATKAHLDRLRQVLTAQGISPAAQRFRGLASVPAATLWQRCLDPNTRRLVQVSVADAQLALRVFEQMRQLGKNK
jgi:topoisomerase-4 subunit B